MSLSALLRWPQLQHGFVLLVVLFVLGGCSSYPVVPLSKISPTNARSDAALTPTTQITRDLVSLPMPLYKVPVGVYAFRDMTGQFKPQPESNLSNAVTQGAASLLINALLDSKWFVPIEREGLQNLLTERRIARAQETTTDKSKPPINLPQLLPAYYLIEGGITGYEQNVRTGGLGANLLGVGANVQFQVDQVTVNLRLVDVRSGQIVDSVMVTKSVYSNALDVQAYRYVAWKTLLQAEGGYTSNEPAQLAVKEAIESAVIHLILQGVHKQAWFLRNDPDWNAPLVQAYLKDVESNRLGLDIEVVKTPPLRAPSMLLMPAQRPQILRNPTEPAKPASVAPVQDKAATADPMKSESVKAPMPPEGVKPTGDLAVKPEAQKRPVSPEAVKPPIGEAVQPEAEKMPVKPEAAKPSSDVAEKLESEKAAVIPDEVKPTSQDAGKLE